MTSPVVNVTVITPADPTPNHTLRLSSLDSQLFLRFTFEYLLVYHPRPALHRPALADSVRAALSRALVPYYPLSGRVRNRPDSSGLEVVCRAQGALFIEAVSSSTVHDFAGAGNDPQWRNLLSLPVHDVLQGAPPLVLQLTWLSDGGAALAVGFNHCLCDGVGSGNFLNAFAELAAAGRRKWGELKPPQPTWSRHLLDKASSRTQSSRHPEFTGVPDLCGFTARYARERMVPTSLTYDVSRVKELKKLTGSARTTSFEALASHIWRSWARALCLPPNQIVKLLFSVNVRDRVEPRLPNGYYGNALVLGCVQAHVKELTERSLAYGAEMVRMAKERVGDGYVREVVEAVSAGATVDLVGVLIMTEWTKLGLQRVDFGMGKPLHVGPLYCDRYCILSPAAEQSIKVSLGLPTSAVDHYLNFVNNP